MSARTSLQWSDGAAGPLLAGAEPQNWRDLALCTEVDAELFFPARGEAPRDAKRVCALCEVSAQCLDFAMEHDIRFGVFGGMSEMDRRKLRSKRARAAREARAREKRAEAARTRDNLAEAS